MPQQSCSISTLLLSGHFRYSKRGKALQAKTAGVVELADTEVSKASGPLAHASSMLAASTMNKIFEMYFRLYNSESDHLAIQWEIEEACALKNVEMMYYRRIKTGHIPMIRECKLRGNRGMVLSIVEPYKDWRYPTDVDYFDERLLS